MSKKEIVWGNIEFLLMLAFFWVGSIWAEEPTKKSLIWTIVIGVIMLAGAVRVSLFRDNKGSETNAANRR